MRLLFRLVLLLLLLLAAGLAALVWFGLSDQPQVTAVKRLSHQDIARARTIVQQNDPRRLPAGTRRQLKLSEGDVNLAANYLLQQRASGGVVVSVGQGIAFIDASVRLHKGPKRGYLNLSFTLLEGADWPRLSRLRLGRIAVPDTLSRLLLSHGLARPGRSRGFGLALASVQKLEMRPGQIRLSYEWQPELLAAMRDQLLPPGQTDAMAAYYQRLAQLHATGRAVRGSLAEALPPLFQLAAERSRQGDPVTENRALLAVLGAWASGNGMDRLLSDAQRQGRLARFRLKLQRRDDFAQHFLTSAALAANADTVLSDAIGLYKEVRDSQGGSGFSFTDIAADRTGTRFGGIAVAGSVKARDLQRRLSQGLAEDELMPPARDLPEHLSAAEFERRFGGVDSPAYQRVMADIERRIDALPLYR